MDDKAFGILTADIKAAESDEDNPNGTFEAILSAPTVDRDGEVIDAGAFEPLPDHLTIDIDHGMSTETTVGSGTPFYDGETLMFRGQFSSLPRAQDVRTLVTEGHVRKMSVAFMNAHREDDEDDGRVHIRKAELLNAAIVPIPSNREASILAAKAASIAIDMVNSGVPGSLKVNTDSAEPVSLHVETAETVEVATTEATETAAAPAPAITLAPVLAKARAREAEAALLLTQ